ncbi:photosystem II reaction center protein Psb28 [Prochlorococcus sp. MIT 1223]|uniref:photosystem II reaction center protein Psb28 n=1 Tax=Prochlorococcus sp. MIT 1223 TaxID=3096217 RepID=UPI002A760590|nr:photosystem II reaction center protein Psb28 [Prochlorococcus sp. MIT 1223]
MKNKFELATIKFTSDIQLSSKPEIRLQRNRDGKSGKAHFLFKYEGELQLSKSSKTSEMIMKDPEGEITSREIKLYENNDKNKFIEFTYRWKTIDEFQRFIRFANKYSREKHNPDTINMEDR